MKLLLVVLVLGAFAFIWFQRRQQDEFRRVNREVRQHAQSAGSDL